MRYSGALLLWLPPWSAGAFIRSLFVVRRERLNAGLAGRLDELPDDIAKLVNRVTLDLWDGHDIPVTKSDDPSVRGNALEGEAGLPFDVAFDERAEFFRAKALDGDPRAQHSYALLRWSGFGGVARDELESAKFHAAAA
ncbi:hypothetical protein THAOC_03191, partial [Thalassiosira oceanica]